MTTETRTIANMLTAKRINWDAVIAAGGDLERIEAEAGMYGDAVLLRKVRAAMTRR